MVKISLANYDGPVYDDSKYVRCRRTHRVLNGAVVSNHQVTRQHHNGTGVRPAGRCMRAAAAYGGSSRSQYHRPFNNNNNIPTMVQWRGGRRPRLGLSRAGSTRLLARRPTIAGSKARPISSWWLPFTSVGWRNVAVGINACVPLFVHCLSFG
jgi:hypothetical protein